ncbi:alpha-2-macroglobulin family protein [Paraliomyxa miuraensis]|uniref:alpha-2-macroglobulin family protein n=1 Tax=Paraliomyxa miuraensis TaxID=376150 RepID=UPI00224FFCB3|nr:MG2 domain-containing protein [Paraliomyxa miuraensis]MCX4244785.1 MG2 domain-containing protein [Paraliomyxa miuraensis]
MPRNRAALALLLIQALACQPVPTATGGGDDAATPDSPFRASATGADLLVFPPQAELHPRRVLPRHLAEAEHTEEAQTDVEWPELDDDGTFEIAGRTLRIHFNRAIEPPADPDAALTIEPAIAGKASMPSAWVLQFQADAPFDPDTEYTAALGELHDADGKRVAEGWKGTFTAEPRVDIAGKVISYLPTPGEPRVVAVRPEYVPKVSRSVAPRVLFDQPVSLAEVSRRITATVDGHPRRLELHHAKDDRFEGVAIDRHHVVVAKPVPAPGPGQQLTLAVTEPDGSAGVEQEYEVAEPLAFEEVSCDGGYYDEHECTWKDGTLGLEGRRFMVRWNNTIAGSDAALAKQVKVTPRVDDLHVQSDTWRSDGALWISGDFRSSTHYEVEIGRVRDRFGSTLRKPVRFSVEAAPKSASVSMPEGQQVLDEAASRRFAVQTRNVEAARIEIWEVEPSTEAWEQARRQLSARERPSEAPDLSVPIRPRARRDESVTTTLDLLDVLTPGKTYLAQLGLETTAFGAKPPSYPEWSMAARPATALLTPHDDRALAVHVHGGRDQTLVHVARLDDGRAVAGARVRVDGEEVPGVVTGADGLAVVPRSLAAPGGSRHHVLEVEGDDARATLVMGMGSLDEGDLAPELGGGATPLGDIRALVLSDRGVYRPGSSVGLKGIVEFRDQTHDRGRLSPASTMPVGLRIHAPTGKLVHSEDGLTSDMGGFSTRFEVPSSAEIGRYRVELVAPLRDDAVLASYGIQVAEFEPPRFTVDVEAQAIDGGQRLSARVDGRYLFGAAMEEAPVTWTLRRQDAPFPQGPLTAKGLHFREAPSWWDEDEDEAWLRTGEGRLDTKGRLDLSPAVELDAEAGPQRFVLEAEVTDESHRAIAGRASVVLHTAPRYAGLRLAERWVDVGKALPLEVGVVDQEGATVSDAAVEVRLERLEWQRVRRPGPGGFADEEWHEVGQEVGRCEARTAEDCRLVPKRSGSYRVSAFVDGRRGGGMRLWAWGHGGGAEAPSPGRRVELVADRDRYRPGDTAQIMVRNPFPAATMILTVEQGAILHHESRTVTESATSFSVPLTHEHTPHAYATVTILPREGEGEGKGKVGAADELSGQARVDWKLGAIRLPVELSDARLDVVVASDRDHYAPGEEVDVVVDVSRGGTAVANAEVVLAVVDEGVLRLTNFHAPDPVPALYPGQGLDLWIDDSRRLLAEQLGRSHVAGDGSGAGSHSLVSTRKDFVETAVWEPALRTDAAGRAHVHFTLPDNLTRFRMMAVVVDAEGRGGVHEDDFEVRKPLMAIPAVPRFAALGDRFEAAVLVHNNQDHAETATVSLGGDSRQVELPARGRTRVAFERAPTRAVPLQLEFVVADGSGTVRDRVQARVPVQAPGIDERPYLHGSFMGRQELALEIPADVFADATGDDHLTVTVGENLWPELGQRVEYLVGYPHGCVEQTTSSTLPLLAAREILPRLGLVRYTDQQLRDMIEAGVERLSTMRTSTGGLAYWPGGYEPNPFGTAYATLAIARAQRLGIEAPEGMIDGMREYLLRMVEADQLPHGYGVEVRASIALALAELDALPPSVADSLFDTASAQGTFGTATLALALSSLPEQDDRVATLVQTLESSFDEEGNLARARDDDDFAWYGSDQRSIAQATLALSRLRPQSTVLPALVSNLMRRTGDYTTQATAYGLLALAERLAAEEGSGARQRALLDDVELLPELASAVALGPSARRYRIPLSRVQGRRAILVLESESDRAQAFMVSARWRRSNAPVNDDQGHEDEGRAATTTDNGPDLYRVITDAKGRSVDFDRIVPGQVLRVVLLARMPEGLPHARRGYLALTDRLPAGFEAMQPDLWTVASVPELDQSHPLYDALRWTGSTASHVELRDDRAHFYFDRFWGEWVHATYLMRATTPGTFTAPPAMAELMYEPDSAGYSQAKSFTVLP